MKEKQRFASPSSSRAWTRSEDYIEALARKRSFRRGHRERLRTEPESPRLLLSTLPFLALIAFLGVLAVAIAILAFPGTQPPPGARPQLVKEQGVAQRGWFQEAQKDFHH